MNDGDSQQREDLSAALRSVRRRMRILTVAVLLMMLGLVLDVAAVFGRLVEFDGRAGLQRGSIAAAAALLGFGVGWIIAALAARASGRAKSTPIGSKDSHQSEDLSAILHAVGRRTCVLTVAVLLMTLGLMLNMAAVFGSLVGYHASELLMRGATAAGVAVLGVVFGWVARRRA